VRIRERSHPRLYGQRTHALNRGGRISRRGISDPSFDRITEAGNSLINFGLFADWCYRTEVPKVGGSNDFRNDRVVGEGNGEDVSGDPAGKCWREVI